MRNLGVTGLNLRGLEHTGQLTRFITGYLAAYGREFDHVFLFSPCPDDMTMIPGNTSVIPPRMARFPSLDAYLAPFLHPEMKECRVHRVMHMTGCVSAVILRLFWRIPFVATFGYDYRSFVWFSVRPRLLLWIKYVYVSAVMWIGLRTAAKVIVTCPGLPEELLPGEVADRMVMIPNGVDTSTFFPRETPEVEIPLLRILFVGRLERQKNLVYLIEELGMMTGIPYQMTFVGDGSLRQELVWSAEAARVNCEFRGTVPYPELPSVFRSHHVFVLPSLLEGLPKALLEAMSCGLCCIGSDIEGIRTLLKHEETGLVESLTRNRFASAVRRIWNDPVLRIALGNNARRHILERYDLAPLIAKETSLLTEVAA